MADYPMIRFAFRSGVEAGLQAAARVFASASMQPIVEQTELSDRLLRSLNEARSYLRSFTKDSERQRCEGILRDALGRPQQ